VSIHRKGDFVSGGLHRIRDKIAESTASHDKAVIEAAVQSSGAEPAPADPPPPPPAQPDSKESKELQKALDKRHDEFVKSKRDLIFRLSEALASLPEESDAHKSYASEIDKAVLMFKESLSGLETVKSPPGDSENYSAELAASLKAVEGRRLEFLKESARLAKLKSFASPGGGQSPVSSIIHEINSLSPRQLTRLGLWLMLPMALCFSILFVILAAVIAFSMRY
jgi:hypothetical protein